MQWRDASHGPFPMSRENVRIAYENIHRPRESIMSILRSVWNTVRMGIALIFSRKPKDKAAKS